MQINEASVDLKIKLWESRAGFFPLCENFRYGCKQRQVWLCGSAELRRARSTSNLPG